MDRRDFLTLVSYRANHVELLIVPSVAIVAAYVVVSDIDTTGAKVIRKMGSERK
jgi:hypothetical protein